MWSTEKVHGELGTSGSFERRVGIPGRFGALVSLNQALHFPSKEASSPSMSFCNSFCLLVQTAQRAVSRAMTFSHG